jgi:hypothetical protein
MEQSPELRTRTSIAHAIAKKHSILWQNIYSGIFRDLDEVLIPAGIVKEGGRLPLRRGPRALQLEGVPFYELSEAGLLVASSIEELANDRMRMLKSYIMSVAVKDQNDKMIHEAISLLIRLAPSFISKLIREYVYAYSIGLIDSITPINTKKLQSVVSKQIIVERELIEAFIVLQSDQKELIRNFFKLIG